MRRWGQARHHAQTPHVSLYPDHSGVSTFLAVFSLPGICRVVHFQLLDPRLGYARATLKLSLGIGLQKMSWCGPVIARNWIAENVLVRASLAGQSAPCTYCRTFFILFNFLAYLSALWDSYGSRAVSIFQMILTILFATWVMAIGWLPPCLALAFW